MAEKPRIDFVDANRTIITGSPHTAWLLVEHAEPEQQLAGRVRITPPFILGTGHEFLEEGDSTAGATELTFNVSSEHASIHVANAVFQLIVRLDALEAGAGPAWDAFNSPTPA